MANSSLPRLHDLVHRAFRRGVHAFRLDGDNVRHGLNNNLGFSRQEQHLSKLCKEKPENLRPSPVLCARWFGIGWGWAWNKEPSEMKGWDDMNWVLSLYMGT